MLFAMYCVLLSGCLLCCCCECVLVVMYCVTLHGLVVGFFVCGCVFVCDVLFKGVLVVLVCELLCDVMLSGVVVLLCLCCACV